MWSEKEKGCMKMKVGFIGLGIMERPMAKNLLNAGVDLLVSDLNKEHHAEILKRDKGYYVVRVTR